jgi:acetoin utilization deacetylase AcuC-like enzyme
MALADSNSEPNSIVRFGRFLRRRWRRFRRRWLAPQVRFVYHDSYALTLDGAPNDPTRGQKIIGFLIDEGLLDREDISVPRRPAVRSLLRAHDHDYIDSVGLDPEVTEKIFGTKISDVDIARVVEMQRRSVGGTIQATRLALHGRSVAINLGGGYHHAERDRGMGFCIFNDIAVAIARLRSKGFREPVLVVDLDVHDGNGTRSIFAHDSTVYTYSVHNNHWGETEARASTAIALGADVGDEIYLGTLLKTLPDVMMNFRPGLVIYVAGTDPAADDTLGNWKISADGMFRRDRLVMEIVRHARRRMPTVILLGGGYGNASWRYSARLFSWLITKDSGAQRADRRAERLRLEPHRGRPRWRPSRSPEENPVSVPLLPARDRAVARTSGSARSAAAARLPAPVRRSRPVGQRRRHAADMVRARPP